MDFDLLHQGHVCSGLERDWLMVGAQGPVQPIISHEKGSASNSKELQPAYTTIAHNGLCLVAVGTGNGDALCSESP